MLIIRRKQSVGTEGMEEEKVNRNEKTKQSKKQGGGLDASTGIGAGCTLIQRE